jgi:lactate dehydrogenase-like 2-hydroxyacid dehydrogenase
VKGSEPVSGWAKYLEKIMNIAILQDSSLNDEHIARLEKIGPLNLYDVTDGDDQALQRLRNTDVAVVNRFHMSVDRVIRDADQLKLLVLRSTGYSGVDLEAASKNGVKVANIPGFQTEAVAEHTIALMFAVIRRLPLVDRKIRDTPRPFHGEESDKPFLGFEVKGKTLGIVGLGNIGQRVAELGLGLGMKVVAYNRTPRQMQGVVMVDVDQLVETSDIISVNLALAPETENIISERRIGLMKESAVLISTCSPKLVDPHALQKALKEKRIFGAGLDVIEWDEANPLLKLDNVVLSPESAWWTKETLANFPEIIVRTIEGFAKGKPVHLLN